MSLGTCALLCPEQMGRNGQMAPWGAPTHGYRSPQWEHQGAGSGNSAADTARSSCPLCGPGSCHTPLRGPPGCGQTQLGRSDRSLSGRCSHILKKEFPGLPLDQRLCQPRGAGPLTSPATSLASHNSATCSGLGNGETEAQGDLCNLFNVI